MAEFRMPALGADMDEGTLVEWLVKPGDEIRKGEPIAVVDTAKSAIEVESFHTGTVAELVIPVGETVPVGTVLATITEPGAAAPAAAPASAEAAPKAGKRAVGERAAARPASAPELAPPPAAVPVSITPLVRREAAELGVDPARVHGTGRGGAITRMDVERAAAAAAGAAAAGRARPRRAAAGARAPGRAAAGAAAAGQAAAKAAVSGRAAAGAAAAGPPGPAAAAAGAAVWRPRVSPLARRVAAELGVDLARVTGTGAQGAIREGDVRKAARTGGRPGADRRPAPAGKATPAGARPEPAAAGTATGQPAARAAAAGRVPAGREERALAMRQAIARLMARSKREIPHYYVSNTADMSAAMSWLRERNRELPVSERLVPAALLLKAAALAARQIPQVNGYWIDDHFDQAGHVHLGTAISLRGGGLVTPAIHDADQLSAGELMAGLRDLVTRARAGRLRRAELTDATLTVTNLGDQGVESVYGVIYPPQVALVGFGKVTDRPWAAGGMLGVRPVVITTLAADHRATDGYTGARYLAAIADLLQQPEEL